MRLYCELAEFSPFLKELAPQKLTVPVVVGYKASFSHDIWLKLQCRQKI
jgi:hypothetical protein